MKKTKKKKRRFIDYAALLNEEENDRLMEKARSHIIEEAIQGNRCPDRAGVIKLLNIKRQRARWC